MYDLLAALGAATDCNDVIAMQTPIGDADPQPRGVVRQRSEEHVRGCKAYGRASSSPASGCQTETGSTSSGPLTSLTGRRP
jgi:hypothetical protein